MSEGFWLALPFLVMMGGIVLTGLIFAPLAVLGILLFLGFFGFCFYKAEEAGGWLDDD